MIPEFKTNPEPIRLYENIEVVFNSILQLYQIPELKNNNYSTYRIPSDFGEVYLDVHNINMFKEYKFLSSISDSKYIANIIFPEIHTRYRNEKIKKLLLAQLSEEKQHTYRHHRYEDILNKEEFLFIGGNPFININELNEDTIKKISVLLNVHFLPKLDFVAKQLHQKKAPNEDCKLLTNAKEVLL